MRQELIERALHQNTISSRQRGRRLQIPDLAVPAALNYFRDKPRVEIQSQISHRLWSQILVKQDGRPAAEIKDVCTDGDQIGNEPVARIKAPAIEQPHGEPIPRAASIDPSGLADRRSPPR